MFICLFDWKINLLNISIFLSTIKFKLLALDLKMDIIHKVNTAWMHTFFYAKLNSCLDPNLGF